MDRDFGLIVNPGTTSVTHDENAQDAPVRPVHSLVDLHKNANPSVQAETIAEPAGDRFGLLGYNTLPGHTKRPQHNHWLESKVELSLLIQCYHM